MIGCIIQTRTGSSRLPGKIMMSINKNIPINEGYLKSVKEDEEEE